MPPKDPVLQRSLGDMYGKLLDWYEQKHEYEYGRKVTAYQKVMTEYESLCTQKLKQILILKDPTLKAREKKEREELKKCKADKEKFLEFASKQHIQIIPSSL